MSQLQIARQSGIYVVGRAAQVVAFVLVLPGVTRLLSPEQYGTVAVALVVYQAVAAFAGMGVTSVVAWDIYEHHPDGLDRARRLVMSTALVAVGCSLAVHLTGQVWTKMFSGLTYEAPLQLAVWTVVPFTIQAAALSVLQALGRPGWFTISTIVSTVGGQVLGLSALLVEPTPAAYLAGVLAGTIAGALVALLVVRPHPLRWASREATIAAIRHGGPTVPHQIGFMVLAVADRVLVENELGLDEAARYQTAYLVGFLGLSLIGSINYAWAPAVYSIEDDQRRWRMLSATSAEIHWLAAATVVVVACAAPAALSVVAPSSYDPSDLGPVCALVALAALPTVTYLGGVHVLFQRKRTGALLWIMPLAGTANIAANLVLLPRIGLVGAGLATLVGYGVTAIAARWAGRRLVGVPWCVRREAAAYAASAGAVAVTALLPPGGPVGVIRVVVGVLVAVLVGLRVLAVARSSEDQWSAVTPASESV